VATICTIAQSLEKHYKPFWYPLDAQAGRVDVDVVAVAQRLPAAGIDQSAAALCVATAPPGDVALGVYRPVVFVGFIFIAMAVVAWNYLTRQYADAARQVIRHLARRHC